MKKDAYEDFGGKIVECDCGKRFIQNPNWVYKIRKDKNKIKYYCSYTCWRKACGGNARHYASSAR